MKINRPSGFSTEILEDYGDRTAELHELYSENDPRPLAVKEFAEGLGFELDLAMALESPWPNLLVQGRGSSSLGNFSLERRILLAATMESSLRTRFRVAQLLGVYFVSFLSVSEPLDHSLRFEFFTAKPQEDFLQSQEDHRRMLLEANLFASGLLMPARILRRAIELEQERLENRAIHELNGPSLEEVLTAVAHRLGVSFNAVRTRYRSLEAREL